MSDQAYWGTKRFYTLIAASFFWTIFLILVLGFMGPVMAGPPVGEEVYFYDVAPIEFKVVWQVDTPSTTCTVNVYDQSGNQLSPSPVIKSITDGSIVLQKRGLMVVEVSDLEEDTTYLVQTISTDSQNVVHTYPQPAVPGTLLEVTTEKTIQTPAEWENGFLGFALYCPNGITEDPTQNIISYYDKIIVLLETEGANYPISAIPFEFFTGIFGFWVDCTLFIIRDAANNSQWLNWTTDTNDHPITIRILGGVTPSAGLGYKTINKTYLNSDEGLTFPCLADGGNDIAACYGDEPPYINQINLLRCPEEIQEIPLNAGWNLISYQIGNCYYEGTPPNEGGLGQSPVFIPQGVKMKYVGPGFDSLEAWLSNDANSPLRDAADPNKAGNWQRFKSSDSNGTRYMDKDLPPVINRLRYLSPGYGYWVKMNEPGTLVLKGQFLPGNTQIELRDGWNLIGYIPNDICYSEIAQEALCPYTKGVYLSGEVAYCPADLYTVVPSVFDSIDGQYRRIKASDECGGTVYYDTTFPPVINKVRYIGPKYGYWIKVENPAGVVLTFPESCAGIQ